MGNPENWKEVIRDQIKTLMVDISIGSTFIKSSLRFFKVENDHHRETAAFEKEFLELKAKA
ncbi:hypothetical protein APR41_02210 [Salegentibacter salinarum]|uniref:Uncharacterized protein n=1 Tax=Salegentibacter salinarum TaxID=447422 RepID=A0A2N0U4B7_9FLAO|nr:hypothetical protein [Salegentibacter salinarum]PKD21815.1 hypothetical protein APR41_02210 [Salegentibacter salinarum]SKB33340.1 hypothetical protein SAMN05660903_00116 [Salegentibacter salinarum]